MAPKLGEILVRERACTSDAVRDALKNQVVFGGRLGTNLLEIGAVAEDALARALGRQHGVPALFGPMVLDPRATALLTAEVADRCDAVPYARADRRLAVVAVSPNDLAMLDEVSFATGKEIHALVAPEARVWALLREAYGIDRHLRGIEVDFAGLKAKPTGSPDAARRPRPAGPDLMDEGAFDALYGTKPVAPALPPASSSTPASVRTPPERPALTPIPADGIINLTDLVEEPPASPPAALAAEVLAAISATPGHVPPERLVRPAEPEPSPLGFAEAIRLLEGVAERDAIATAVLRFARSRFARAVLFTVHRGGAHGWVGLGAGLRREAVRQIHVALGTPGILDTVVRTQAHFLGPIPKTEANIRLLRAIGGGVPKNALVVPILAVGRVVNVFYADGGKGKLVDAGGVGELLILATRIAKSYDALVARVR